MRVGVACWCYEGVCGLVNVDRRTFSNRCPHNAGMTSPKPSPAAPRPPKEGKGGDLSWVKKLAGRASYVYFRGGSSSPRLLHSFQAFVAFVWLLWLLFSLL